VALWNKAIRSTGSADKVTEIAEEKLLVPTPITLDSCYDAVLWITENSSTELNELCTAMGL